ncbi:MAG TPA: efflux RND transporter periplasmic adaptor subunit [bacterium]|nr:efflux RND transporter periplasmic adaptor subunit [bacterium]
MNREKLYKLGFPLLAAGMLLFALTFVLVRPERKPEAPVLGPVNSAFVNRVAGIGLVEPRSENIAIGTQLPGVVSKVSVAVGQKVAAGDSLFTVDSRDAKAQLALAQARLESARVERADLKHQLGMFERVSDRRAISEDELSRRRYASQLANAKVKEAEAQVEVYQTELDRLDVKAPIAGTVLKVDVRPGEYVNGGSAERPYVVLGDVDVMHVRVEIDETDIPRVDIKAKAVASLRGYGDKKVALNFVRKEPFILPKRSLTNDGNERVDTRVQQILYSFDNSNLQSFSGQQMDVFIETGSLVSGFGAKP